jgi:hypothetical protein
LSSLSPLDPLSLDATIAEAVNPEPTFSDERRQAGHEKVHCKKNEKASRCRDEGATGGEIREPHFSRERSS